MSRLRRGLVEWAPALAILVLGLIGWELAVQAFGIQKFLLPKPSEILAAFWDQREHPLAGGLVHVHGGVLGLRDRRLVRDRRRPRARPLPRRSAPR